MTALSRCRSYGWFFLVAAVGRLGIFFLFRDQWGWQPPYHLVFLQAADSYDSVAHEYMVRQMPLYPAFLKAIGSTGFSLYAAAPILQTILQLAAIAQLSRQLAERVLPGRRLAVTTLSFALGLDPWLADTAIIMQPASLTATLFILLIERSLRFCSETIDSARPVEWWKVAATSGVLGAAGAYMRADFATYSILPALTVAVCVYCLPNATVGRVARFAAVSGLASLGLVIVLLLPRSVLLRPHTGVIVLTTHTGGGALWAGLGEIPNPWGIPNPEDGDEPIGRFAEAHGYASPFGSARTSAFFKDLFWDHVREQPSILPKLVVFRIHRMLLGWPPQSITFVGDYRIRPELNALGARLSSEGWLRVMFSRDWTWLFRQVGLRYIGTILIWVALAAAGLFVVRSRVESPLLAVPALAYGVGVAIFAAVHWSNRYGQQFYWLGYLGAAFIVTRAAMRRPAPVSSPAHTH
jgi:hypothetical protein